MIFFDKDRVDSNPRRFRGLALRFSIQGARIRVYPSSQVHHFASRAMGDARGISWSCRWSMHR
jgi:hypothetical protein